MGVSARGLRLRAARWFGVHGETFLRSFLSGELFIYLLSPTLYLAYNIMTDLSSLGIFTFKYYVFIVN
jgi:hypothetical protein